MTARCACALELDGPTDKAILGVGYLWHLLILLLFAKLDVERVGADGEVEEKLGGDGEGPGKSGGDGEVVAVDSQPKDVADPKANVDATPDDKLDTVCLLDK